MKNLKFKILSFVSVLYLAVLTTSCVDELSTEPEGTQQTAMAKQAFDLALLAQGMLKGADLTAFVERSVEVL